MEYYFNTSSSSYNLSTACSIKSSVFANLTTSYAQQLNDASTMSASFIMFALTALFFILNLFSRLSDVSTILDPKVRVGLTSALSLFLPVMSYLFSEAKNNGGTDGRDDSKTELPQRARFILIWMLLVELVRKKVEEIHMQGYSGTIERAGRVLWLGSLVFSNLQATGRKAMTGVLWILCASKLVQRISFTEFGKRSLALGRNTRLISSYMAQVLAENDEQKQPGGDVDEPLRTCKYAVMGEEKLVEAIPSGYSRRQRDGNVVATVGKIWEADPLLDYLDGDKRLRRLCLSFSLFKLLRRRFEHHLPALPSAETRNYRKTIFRALHDSKRTITAEAFFDVTNDELSFLCEYNHSVVPVVLASPFFLLANYFLFPIVVFVLCLVLVVLCSNGDVPFAFRSIKRDNYFTLFGVMHMAPCLPQVFKSPIVFLCTVDFAITFLLFTMFIYEEAWEFFVFLFSDWFLVSLLGKYTCSRSRHIIFGWSVRCILFARSLMHRPSISFSQLSVLNKFCGVIMPAHIVPFNCPVLLRAVPVSKQVKHSITAYFTKLYDDREGNNTMADNAAALSNGRSALVATGHADLLPFCECDSIAEVILTWHIATSLLEVDHPPHHQSNDSSKVAISLFKYCAYLVAFHPELLPENQDSADQVFKAMKLELFQLLGFWGYYFPPCTKTRYARIKSCTDESEETVVVKGATLANKLASKAAQHSDDEVIWNMLAQVWVELLVFIAPSSDEDCVRAHADVLAKGGEFVTVLWAMATHAGITRPADDAPPAAIPIDHAQGVDHVCV